MALRHYPHRIWWMTAVTSTLVLIACGLLIVYFNQQQSQTADALGENIGSRRAAGNLEATLNNLIALHRRGVQQVEALHERVENDLAEIERFADKDRERQLNQKIANGFYEYQKLWKANPENPKLEALLEPLQKQSLPSCQELREFNSRQIDESEKVHRQSLHLMATGVVIVGGMSSIAGLVLGYGLARSLRRQLHQLLVRVQGASDLLGSELPTVELSEPSEDPLQSKFQELIQQIERAVERLQQREREMRRSERLAAVGQLAAGVAHEIRNPLTSVKLLIQTSQRDPDAGSLSDEDLSLIEQEILRLEKTIQTFLDFARPPQLERTDGDLAKMIKRMTNLIRGRAEQQKVRIESSGIEEPLPIYADGEQLQQVLINLSLNALDAMPQGGQLRIEVEPPMDGWIEFLVLDTGPGIPEDLWPRLFEPFASTKSTGLGLGLVICKRIIEEHGGIINYQARATGGSCWRCRIPVAKAKKVPSLEVNSLGTTIESFSSSVHH